MKITKVDVMCLEADMKTSKPIRPIVCRIYTDEGIYGDGEAALAYGTGAPAAFGMIKDMASLIIGMDPLDNEVIWDTLYKRTFWGQNGGPVVFSGISAIDIALWDIRGKAFQVPVYILLGGKMRDSLRAYASQLQFGWQDGFKPALSTEDYIDQSRKTVSQGYDAIKIDFFTFDKEGRGFTKEDRARLLKPEYVNLVEERISAVRNAIGPNVDIIIENHSNIDAQAAVQLGRMAEKYNIFYFEEPSTPSPLVNKHISQRVNIPIAHGERIFTRWQYLPYFNDGSIQVAQPDLGTSGGITEVKKICDLAYIYDVNMQIHVCGSPLCTAAALQLECVIPNFLIHEHHVFATYASMRRLCKNDYQPENGFLKVPEIPGIGNEVSDYALEHCQKITVS